MQPLVTRFFFRFFLLFAFLVPLSQTASTVLLVILFLGAILPKGRIRLTVNVLRHSWELILYVFVLVAGLAYSEDRDTGFRAIETSLALIAMPFVIQRLSPVDKHKLNTIFWSFTAGLAAAGIICLVSAAVRYQSGGETGAFFFYQLTGVLDSHPTYLAYYLIAGLTFGLFALHAEKSPTRPMLLALIQFFLFGVLLLTGGTTAMVSMLFVLSYFMLKFFLEGSIRIHLASFLVVVAMATGLFAFNELRNVDPSGFVIDDSWERIHLWEAALKASPPSLGGVGTGDYRNVLNAYYNAHGMTEYAVTNFNAHNQFIETYIANGLIGLIVLLIMLIRPLYLSVQKNNTLGALIFFPFLIYGMTEVFLGRYQGVVFFALMSQCLTAYNRGFRPSFVLKRV